MVRLRLRLPQPQLEQQVYHQDPAEGLARIQMAVDLADQQPPYSKTLISGPWVIEQTWLEQQACYPNMTEDHTYLQVIVLELALLHWPLAHEDSHYTPARSLKLIQLLLPQIEPKLLLHPHLVTNSKAFAGFQRLLKAVAQPQQRIRFAVNELNTTASSDMSHKKTLHL